MKLKRIMIAAPKSESGKTTITCALLQSLKDCGHNVVSYKCGPDYIDPMFHKKVIGIPAKNLDTFFTGEEKTKELFLKNRSENDFALMEGVMGLFDGLGGIREEGSSYHLAKVTKTPIVLVVDAKGMGRSVIPMIAGFLQYDEEKLIKGVILNKMSKSYYEIIRPLLEQELGIEVLGYFPESKEFHVESRHLGLKMPDELEDTKTHLQRLAEEIVKTISVKKIIDIANEAEEINSVNVSLINKSEKDEEIVIGVAKDEAFCFYYEDNLLMLQECGAKIEYFSPLHDEVLPKECNGLLIGGGYPELYAKELSKNTKMLSSIKDAIENGMPTIAECGGFMYLHKKIIDKTGNSYNMAGVIPHICTDMGKLVRFGYIELEEQVGSFLPRKRRIRGHEFHYYDSTDNGDDCIAVKPVTGKTYPCVMEGESYWFGFPHLYYPSNPEFVKKFMEKVRKYRKETR